jgi:NADH-quinone oxidoreductase subunit K
MDLSVVKLLSILIVGIAIVGIAWNFNNLIKIFLSIELLFLAASLNFVVFSAEAGDLHGQIFTLFLLTVAAAESAVGLGLFVVYFRKRGTVSVADANLLKG